VNTYFRQYLRDFIEFVLRIAPTDLDRPAHFGAGALREDHAGQSGGSCRHQASTIFLQWPLPTNYGRAVLRIHDILVWIRIRGSIPPTNGSPVIFLLEKTNF
jgi:hypothetical protein